MGRLVAFQSQDLKKTEAKACLLCCLDEIVMKSLKRDLLKWDTFGNSVAVGVYWYQHQHFALGSVLVDSSVWLTCFR